MSSGDRFRLPDNLADVGDPESGNPFSNDNPRHQVWADATRAAEEEICQINAEASGALTPENVYTWQSELIAKKFDVWARRTIHVIWSDVELRWFDKWLVRYVNSWIDAVYEQHEKNLPQHSVDALMITLRNGLAARLHFWKGEARRYRRQQIAHQETAVKAVEEPSSDHAAITTEAHGPIDSSEISRRSKLLADYKQATGDPPDYRIYTASNSRIHKPQFYDWINGKLPSRSQTAQNFERFLREKHPPIPRQRK
jgi:hypothetical protein